MATFSFTFPLRHGGALLAPIDARAITDDEDVIEVLMADLDTDEMVTVSGELERLALLHIHTDPICAAKLREAVEDECAGRISYDMETAHAAE